VYPPVPLIFNAFKTTPFSSLKVVIVGQDPYIKPGEAMGLSFSVPAGIVVPPSLKNIYKCLEATIPGYKRPDHGDLTVWAKQVVLLLNAVMTVRQGKSNSHKDQGWEEFTSHLIKVVSERKKGMVFLLWGAYAQKKGKVIDKKSYALLLGTMY
jgi:uracil-DNA glycosylase